MCETVTVKNNVRNSHYYFVDVNILQVEMADLIMSCLQLLLARGRRASGLSNITFHAGRVNGQATTDVAS